jgi:hypothetical protein
MQCCQGALHSIQLEQDIMHCATPLTDCIRPNASEGYHNHTVYNEVSDHTSLLKPCTQKRLHYSHAREAVAAYPLYPIRKRTDFAAVCSPIPLLRDGGWRRQREKNGICWQALACAAQAKSFYAQRLNDETGTVSRPTPQIRIPSSKAAQTRGPRGHWVLRRIPPRPAFSFLKARH